MDSISTPEHVQAATPAKGKVKRTVNLTSASVFLYPDSFKVSCLKTLMRLTFYSGETSFKRIRPPNLHKNVEISQTFLTKFSVCGNIH